MKNVITLVLGGGRGSRLYPLTKYRAKPAVPLAGKYRLIDIPISNCINSDLNQVYVLTQFLSVSLHRHLRQTYRFDPFTGGFVELLAAQQTDDAGTDWYQGTADAVRKNLRYFDQENVDYILILSGDQLYRMNYQHMLQTHIDSKADVTIGTMPVDAESARSLGVMRIDQSGRVDGFLEKPQTDEELELVRMDAGWLEQNGFPTGGRECLASMGIYVFNRQLLVDVLTKTSYADFGREIFPAAIRSRHVQVHLFDDYWEDIGTIRAFYEANLSLTQPDPPFDLEQHDAKIYSRSRFLPPTLIQEANIKNSLIADGCRIGRGAVIENSIIGLRCIIGENAVIRSSVVMGADDFDQNPSGVPLGIGNGTLIDSAILDKNCRIGKNVRVANDAGIQDGEDRPDCVVREGIPVVVKDATLPDNWKLTS